MCKKKIAVIGIGGVGGYLAAMLAGRYPHVTLVARGERRKALQEKGLVLHSEYHGERTARPERIVESVEDLEPQDVIFICVKNYSLEEACRGLSHAVKEDTVIIPVMNGVDPGERVRRYVGRGTVVDSLIYIVAFANPDYSITQQGEFADLRIGIQNAGEEEQKKVRLVADLLDGADVDYEAAEDIECEIWRKYILNCAYNVATAYYDNTIGELRSDKKKVWEYEQLAKEAYQVAVRKGVKVQPEHLEEILRKFYEDYTDDATSSLQRDVRAGRRTELETFSGYIVEEGRRLGVPADVSEKMYEGLRERVRACD